MLIDDYEDRMLRYMAEKHVRAMIGPSDLPEKRVEAERFRLKAEEECLEFWEGL